VFSVVCCAASPVPSRYSPRRSRSPPRRARGRPLRRSRSATQEPDRRACRRQDQGPNLIYLSHPKAKEITLGCSGRNYSNQPVRPKADNRKPQPAFLELVASRHPPSSSPCQRTNMLRGATRLHQADGDFSAGDNVSTRYPPPRHALVSRTKTDASDNDRARQGPSNGPPPIAADTGLFAGILQVPHSPSGGFWQAFAPRG